MKIDYLRLAKELTGSNNIDELIESAKKLEEHNISDIFSNISTFNLVDFSKILHIQHPIRGPILFDPYDYQKATLKNLDENNRIMIYSARQMGTSTMLCMLALWEAISKSDQVILFCSSTYTIAEDLMERIQYFIENKSLNTSNIFYDLMLNNIKIKEKNKSSIVFDNGSRIISRAATSCTARGLCINTLIVDNAGYISLSVSKDFWYNVVPYIINKIVLSSAGCINVGFFHDLWTTKNDFVKISLPYSVHPNRDKIWAEDMKQRMGEERFSIEYECSFKNIA